MQEQDPNPIMEEIEKEIADTKRKASDESPLEIEITEEKTQETTAETQKKEANESDAEEQKRKYSANVQRKIDRLTKQRLEAEEQTRDLQESNAQLLKDLRGLSNRMCKEISSMLKMTFRNAMI